MKTPNCGIKPVKKRVHDGVARVGCCVGYLTIVAFLA
jgi:hypothetical protein